LISEEEQPITWNAVAVGVTGARVGVGGGFPETIIALVRTKGRSWGLLTSESLTLTRIMFTGEIPSVKAVNVATATIPEPLGPPAVGAPKIVMPMSVTMPLTLSQDGDGRIIAKAP
jgi:hypothetical protein